MKKNKQGFTLVELMIAVAIVAILTLIAVPSYQESIRESRRSEAHSALVKIQLEQEHWRTLNTSFASSFGTAANDVKQPVSEYYSYAMSNVTATSYTIKATAKTGSSQASDTGCTALTIDQAGTKLPVACW
ncbi:type IV pilin protein [Psychrobium sp. 1_MG-2023]|uniref:type IV pilin protein n=1 Tax=Psychrobium sp. 1_MG-2023 TaxID=3062624 RepID=UPI000C31F21D|nr:type IV pilin protein [Psychrobium sp. 1_MG-2023]MDP2559639.1 type IV pilin protein [Psychrobium sp. 1_MG-2023]PKF59471.1 pilus assembly protein [Alteromonadales bacterium alter-6D02]